MAWADTLIKIRRYLRDPNANIWQDGLLLSAYNDAQNELQLTTAFIQDVCAVRVPPEYHITHIQDWEWPFLGSDTGNYQALRYHQQSETVYCYRWETQVVWGLVDSTAPDEGDHCTHPWEYFVASMPGDVIPLQLPPGFHEAEFVAWDRRPLDYTTRRALGQTDDFWLTRVGKPYAYWRPDKLEDRFCLYPVPTDPVWDDVDDLEQESGEKGTVLFSDDEALSNEYGIVVDTGDIIRLDADVISPDHNVLFIYKKTPTDIKAGSDVSDFPDYMEKYLIYATLESAYAADTDGQIESLRDYWKMRKELGFKVIAKYMRLQKQDRTYRLANQAVPGFRTRREPKLPDHYPAVYPNR